MEESPGNELLRRPLHSLSWSGAYLAATRVSTVVAVPEVLHQLHAPIYSVWAVTGALIMSQGLVDLGIGTATVRFTSVAAALGSREGVISAARSSAFFYGALSLAVSGLMIAFAGPLVDVLHSVRSPHDVHAARTLVVYAAIAFSLTNAAIVLASVLQGIGSVGAAYRGQTIGWVLFIPTLTIGFAAGMNVDAIGLAWIFAYGAQILLLTFDAVRGVRAIPDAHPQTVDLRAMLRLGTRWQVSAWADFATFQVPRLAAAAALSAKDVVALDLGLRFAQLGVTPFFAAYPLVLPEATAAWTRAGIAGVVALCQRWLPLVFAGSLVVVAVAAPIAAPTIHLWSGASYAGRLAVTLPILCGVVAHSSTGVPSSVLLAMDRIRPVINFKFLQLALAVPMLVGAAPFGAVAMSCALGVALLVPACLFHYQAAHEVGYSWKVALPKRPVVVLALSALAAGAGASGVAITHHGSAVAPVVAGLCVAAPIGVLALRTSGALGDWRPRRPATN